MEYKIAKEGLHKAINVWVQLTGEKVDKVTAEQMKDIICLALPGIRKTQIQKINWNYNGDTLVVTSP